jgi:hypothetical protein
VKKEEIYKLEKETKQRNISTRKREKRAEKKKERDM